MHHLLSAPHFAAKNVPIKMLCKQEVVGSNPTAEGLYLRIAQSGRAPYNTFRRYFNFNVANGVPILWLVFCPPKGWKIGFESLIRLATTFQRHREFLFKTECTGSTPADRGNLIVAQR